MVSHLQSTETLEKDCPWRFCANSSTPQFFHKFLNAPVSTLSGDPHMGRSQGRWDPKELFNKLLPVIPLNSLGETKIKINGKLCQILIDTGATLFSLNLLALEPADGILGILAEASKGWEFLIESALLDRCSAWSRKEGKISFVHSIPNPDSCESGFGLPIGYQSINYFPKDSYCLLFGLLLCPENLPWLSACMGHSGCWFLCTQVAQPSGWGPKNMVGQKCGLYSICG